MNTALAPHIAITPGEPAGIGPDLIKALAAQSFAARITLIADQNLLAERAGLTENNLPANWHIKHMPLSAAVVPAKLNQANAQYVLDCLDAAAQGCLDDKYAAMVTGPVQKSVINDAGIAFSGHTEYLAELTTGQPLMLLTADSLRVALVTTHMPLRQVADAITTETVTHALTTLHDCLQNWYGIPQPNIAVLGLNPHAGEGGWLGREEIDTIKPIIEKHRKLGWQLSDPLPADTAFTADKMAQYDAYLAMYHDQGLTVLKHVGFGHAINLTPGLPIVRTSVDHGVALDLAGTQQADIGSFVAAIELAIHIAINRQNQHAA